MSEIVLEMLYECVECMFSNNLNDDPKCLDSRIVSFTIVNTNVIRINSTKGPAGQDFGIVWLKVTWWIEFLMYQEMNQPKVQLDRTLESSDLESDDDYVLYKAHVARDESPKDP